MTEPSCAEHVFCIRYLKAVLYNIIMVSGAFQCMHRILFLLLSVSVVCCQPVTVVPIRVSCPHSRRVCEDIQSASGHDMMQIQTDRYMSRKIIYHVITVFYRLNHDMFCLGSILDFRGCRPLCICVTLCHKRLKNDGRADNEFSCLYRNGY